MVRLFMYGSLLEPQVQRDVIGREVWGMVAELPGYYVGHNEDFPRLHRWHNAVAVGRVVMLTDEEFSHVCTYEGSDYKITQETLTDGSAVLVFR